MAQILRLRRASAGRSQPELVQNARRSAYALPNSERYGGQPSRAFMSEGW